MEIVQERLEREYNLDLITTAPVGGLPGLHHDGRAMLRSTTRPSCPPAQNIEHIEEPILTCHIHVPNEYLGAMLKLCQDRRGVQKDIKYLGSTGKRVQSTYEMPLAEVVFDFYDKLKSVSRGYASLDYELAGYREADLVQARHPGQRRAGRRARVIVHRERAYQRGREVCAEAEGGHPEADVRGRHPGGDRRRRSSPARPSRAMRKNVIAKCYGGDISRKRKLLEKQKEGKKRMKQVGTVEIPQEAFLAVLKTEE